MSESDDDLLQQFTDQIGSRAKKALKRLEDPDPRALLGESGKSQQLEEIIKMLRGEYVDDDGEKEGRVKGAERAERVLLAQDYEEVRDFDEFEDG